MSGDVLVQVAGHGRFVVEVKDRKLPLRRALDQLRGAMTNHEAAAGLLVFSADEHCPAPSPFTTFGEMGMVVFPKDTKDPLALRLACAWARAQAHTENGDGQEFDRHAVDASIEDARRALLRVTDIKKCLGGASRQVGQAALHLDDLRKEVGDALTRVRTQFGR